MNILTKDNFQQIASNHSSDTDFKDFMKLDKDYILKKHIFLVNNNFVII